MADESEDVDAEVIQALLDADEDADMEGEGESEEQVGLESMDSWPSFYDRVNTMSKSYHCSERIEQLDKRRREVIEKLRHKFAGSNTLMDRVIRAKPAIERQLDVSDKRIAELLRYGKELISNVNTCTDRHERNRRIFENMNWKSIQETSAKESIQALAEFDEINNRWFELGGLDEPVALHNRFEAQKLHIMEVMRGKDELIQHCQEEVQRMTDKYYLDQEKHTADLVCAMQRVIRQVELLKDAYKSQIVLLEDAIEGERQIETFNLRKQWYEYFDDMNESFKKNSILIRDRELYYSNKVLQIAEEQMNVTMNIRNELERDGEQLQLEFRKSQDRMLLNSEKLDYNYQVLTKRNEENVIINNQQKRRVSQLTVNVSHLRRKIHDTKKHRDKMVEYWNTDLLKLHKSITETEKKMSKTRFLNKNKFDRVWEINYLELIALIQKVYDIDRILHEQILLMDWTAPKVNLRDINESNRQTNKIQRYSGTKGQSCTRGYDKISNVASKEQEQKKSRNLTLDEELLPETQRLMRNIFRKLSDGAGFLLEAKLIKLLEPFTETEKCLVRIENIFLALSVTTLKEVKQLVKVFQRYTYCPNCMAFFNEQLMLDAYVHGKPLTPIQMMKTRRGSSLRAYTGSLTSETGCPNHYMAMEPPLVLQAINEYAGMVQDRLSLSYPKYVQKQRFLFSIIMDDKDIIQFWRHFDKCMTKENEQLWLKLEHGLSHYCDALKRRVKLDKEVQLLRKQNQELKFFLKEYNI